MNQTGLKCNKTEKYPSTTLSYKEKPRSLLRSSMCQILHVHQVGSIASSRISGNLLLVRQNDVNNWLTTVWPSLHAKFIDN